MTDLVNETKFMWLDGTLAPTTQPTRPLIVDSWLTELGHSRRLANHFERFAFNCAAVGLSSALCPEFFEAVAARIPSVGRIFPKISCTADGELTLELRPAPAAESEARLLVREDSRQLPLLKGPDLSELIALRESVMGKGATDALLVDDTGIVVEAATAAVFWWEGSTLCSSSSPRMMQSVTGDLLRELAALTGFGVAAVARTPEELAGRELWCVNSVHALRVVQSLEIECAAGTAEVEISHENGALASRFRRMILGA